MGPHEDGCRGRGTKTAVGSSREKNEDITMLHVIAVLSISLSLSLSPSPPSISSSVMQSLNHDHRVAAADFRSAINLNEMPTRTEIGRSID